MTEELHTEFFPPRFESPTNQMRANIYVPLAENEDVDAMRKTIASTLGDDFGHLQHVKIAEYLNASYTIHCSPDRATILIRIDSDTCLMWEPQYDEAVRQINSQAKQLHAALGARIKT